MHLEIELTSKNPSILISGATGLVGAHLTATLALQGQSVRALRRGNSNMQAVKEVFSFYTDAYENLFNQIEWVEADILDVPALSTVFEGIKQVYHCAATVSFAKKDYETMRKVNIEGTANMVNLAMEFGVGKFCHVSSIATIDKNESSNVITETNEWNPENNNYSYAITKYGAEMEVWRATQEGLKVVIVNPGVILGSGFWHHNTGKFFPMSDKGLKFYTEGTTGFVGVQDVVRAMIALMQSNINNERFIVVSENWSFKTLFETISKYLGTNPPTVNVQPWMAEMAWRWDTLKSIILGNEPTFTKHAARASLQKYNYSSQKINEKLVFEFEKMDKVVEEIAKDFRKP
jgi:nucleoside-diphosphate-sugar epimerase